MKKSEKGNKILIIISILRRILHLVIKCLGGLDYLFPLGNSSVAAINVTFSKIGEE